MGTRRYTPEQIANDVEETARTMRRYLSHGDVDLFDDDAATVRRAAKQIRKLAAAERRASRLEQALWQLSVEVSGMLGKVEPQLREAMGNTNLAVLRQRWEESRTALSPESEEIPHE